MFILGLVYLIILVIGAIGYFWENARISSTAQWILFAIIGFVLFWSVLNR